MQYLLSHSVSSDDIRQVRVQDMGNQPHCPKVNVQGVPVDGVLDSRADITIMGGDLFKRVAIVAKLWKKYFKPQIRSLVIMTNSMMAASISMSVFRIKPGLPQCMLK